MEQAVEINGAMHTIKTELATLKPWRDWIQENKTPEQYAAWLENKDVNSVEYGKLYNEWLVDQKITHTFVTSDGKKQTNSYTNNI